MARFLIELVDIPKPKEVTVNSIEELNAETTVVRYDISLQVTPLDDAAETIFAKDKGEYLIG